MREKEQRKTPEKKRAQQKKSEALATNKEKVKTISAVDCVDHPPHTELFQRGVVESVVCLFARVLARPRFRKVLGWQDAFVSMRLRVCVTVVVSCGVAVEGGTERKGGRERERWRRWKRQQRKQATHNECAAFRVERISTRRERKGERIRNEVR